MAGWSSMTTLARRAITISAADQPDGFRLTARRDELEIADAVLGGDAAAVTLLHIHGPTGVGKTALLRAVADRAAAGGRATAWIEGPDADEGVVDRALQGLADGPALLCVDMGASRQVEALVTERVLARAGRQTVVGVASRRPARRIDGSRSVSAATRQIRLHELPPEHAVELALRSGAHDEQTAAAAAAWSGGMPAALLIAAQRRLLTTTQTFAAAQSSADVAREVLGRLLDGEDDVRRRWALAVAAMVHVVTPELLRAAGGPDPDEAYGWLTALSSIECSASGLVLLGGPRPLIRWAVATAEPQLDADLRQRLAQHLAHAEPRPSVALDLAEVVGDPEVRRFWGMSGGSGVRADGLREGDGERIRQLLQAGGIGAWWWSTRDVLDAVPDRVVVARDDAGRIVGYSIAVLAAAAPDGLVGDPVLGPWLAHARAAGPIGDIVIWRDALDLRAAVPDSHASGVQAILNTHGLMRSGATNPRRAYLPVTRGHAMAESFARRIGGVREPSLTVASGARTVDCWIVDFGLGGLVGAQRALVDGELGRAEPTRPADPRLDPAPAAVALALLDALGDPVALAAHPLATGGTVGERAASAVALAERWMGQAFTPGPAGDVERAIVRAGLYDDGRTRGQVAEDLGLSRTTFFRRLKLARRQLIATAVVELESCG